MGPVRLQPVAEEGSSPGWVPRTPPEWCWAAWVVLQLCLPLTREGSPALRLPRRRLPELGLALGTPCGAKIGSRAHG